jgi:hypothetical protein
MPWQYYQNDQHWAFDSFFVLNTREANVMWWLIVPECCPITDYSRTKLVTNYLQYILINILAKIISVLMM